jgi:Flp pilus assembly protein TadD/replication-associated recombination protein RarA
MAELYKWTPALQKPEDLQKLLVGREPLIRRLLQAIEEASEGRSLQHFLLIGPRGIGKTHLLLLLYHTVRGAMSWNGAFQNLSQSWEPILLSEEQYGIGSLIDLFIEILKQLKEQSSDEKLQRLLAHVQGIKLPGEAEREMILEYLLQRRSKTGKRLLLLLDNIHMILNSFSEEDQSRLRSIVMSQDLFMIVGSAPTLFEAVFHYEAPFYNFFEVIWLKEITRDEVEELLKKRLEHDKRTEILEKFDEYRPRIRAIVHLTGGNPRLILSLYQIFTQGEIVEVERALLRLLDELTPYFQDRMKDLSEQQRKIIEAMALMEGPSPPTEIAHAAHLPVNVVTAQLKRLEKLNYVRSEREKGKREVLYNISEQLFRLWRQMRVEAGRRRLRFIVTFLKAWFSERELIEFAERAAYEMMRYMEEAKPIGEIIDRLYYLQEAAPESKKPHIGMTRVLGLIHEGNLEEAQGCLKQLESYKYSPEYRDWFAGVWNALGIAYSKKGEYDQAIEAFCKALELKPDLHEAWNNLGVAYDTKGEYDRAIEAYRKALELKPDLHEAWYNLGVAYGMKRELDQAIEALHKALELQPDDPQAWNDLGVAYGIKGEYDQAIKACRKALELKPDFYQAWNNLGNAYKGKGEYEQAVEAYTRAIEIAGDEFVAVVYLSNRHKVFLQLNRKAEALQDVETAYRIITQHQDEELARDTALYLLLLNLDLSQEEAHQSNEKRALEHYQKALNYLSQAPQDQTQDLLALYFKKLFQAKAIKLAEEALALLEAQGQDWAELMRPYRAALDYLKTKDKTILQRLFPEIRQIVEEMVALVEGQS